MEGDRVALLGYGSAVQSCLAAAALVEKAGMKVTVADARFCKPLDHALVRNLAKNHEVIITVEEGSIGGFGSHVAQFMALSGLLDGGTKVSSISTSLLSSLMLSLPLLYSCLHSLSYLFVSLFFSFSLRSPLIFSSPCSILLFTPTASLLVSQKYLMRVLLTLEGGKDSL